MPEAFLACNRSVPFAMEFVISNRARINRRADEIHRRNCYGYVRSVMNRDEVRIVHAPLMMRHQINMMIRDINALLGDIDVTGEHFPALRQRLLADLTHSIAVRDVMNATIDEARVVIEGEADTRPNSPSDA
jgi:hypothetical protein